MAAGTNIIHKRKAGPFIGGDLQAGEIGVDVSNGDLYFSTDGTGVVHVDVSQIAGGGASQLSDLTDVSTSTPTDRNVLVADGTDWESRALTEADISDLGTAVTLNADTDVSGNGWVIDEDNMVSDDATKVPTQQSVKAYVDTKTTGLLDYKEGYDAATNTPDLDTAPSGILKGDTYTVTAAGAFFGTDVEVGDMLIAEQDGPTLVGHWTIVQANVDGVAVVGNGLDQFAATTSAELAGVISDETGSGPLVFANTPSLVTPILGTPTSGTLTNCTDLPVSSGISGLGSGVADFLATPSSANLASAVTDETGSGPLVFGTFPALESPVLTTPQINDTSSDHQYVFAVSELAADRTVTLPLLTGNDTFVFEDHTQTLTNKTISDSGSTIDGGTI